MSEARTPNPNPNTVAALARIIQEIRYLVENPRIQQRTWVASGKEWLPLLYIVHGELTGRTEALPATPPAVSAETILVTVNLSGGENYVQIAFDAVDRTQVNSMRGQGSLTLKNGQHYLTSAEEAQRVVDATRQADDSTGTDPT